MTRFNGNKKYMNTSAANMSYAQKQRQQAAAGVSDAPSNYADLEPRGPLQVKNQVIGLLVQKGDGGEVIPDKTFRETDFGNVIIDRKDLNGAPFRMTVVCEILNPSAEKGSFRGRIKEVLGDMGNSDTRMLTVLRQYGLSQTFPDTVLKEIEDLPTDPELSFVEDEIKNGRKDLRDLLTITIDGEDAKDLDDAISLKREEDGKYRLYVHIADVSNYVKENTALDDEAFTRGTSVYLVDRVIPMLPPKLSNGLCSLNPDKNRLTLTAEMVIDGEGKTIDGDVYESVIKSDRRMSYKECYRILTEEREADSEEYGPILNLLYDMKRLAGILERMRNGRGAVNFDFPETKVILDDDGHPIDVMAYPINFTNGIIEQFMICANEFIASKFSRLKYPFVYRVHEDPDPIKLARFSRIARSFGAAGKLSGDVSPMDVVRFMDSVKDDSARPMLNQLLLRSMAKACYSPQNLGHFGLASEAYCHFTSPIRRYPDLYIHRIIKSYLHGQNSKGHFAPLVDRVASHSSEMERNSVDAERASDDIKICEYMSDFVGEHFDGMITSIIPAGVFVMLESTVEGFVPFRSMRDHYLFDERFYRAVGARSGMKLTIGMPVRVVVSEVNLELNRIDFVFEDGFESERANRRTTASKVKGRRRVKKQKRGKR